MSGGMRRSAATKRKAINRPRLVKTTLQHVVVLRKLSRLKKLVPGCCRRSTAIGLEELLRRTAQYISFLELKVILLKRTIDLHGV